MDLCIFIYVMHLSKLIIRITKSFLGPGHGSLSLVSCGMLVCDFPPPA